MSGRLRIGSIVFHCSDFRTMMKFWQDALHYVPRNPPTGDWVVLTDPAGTGPNISIGSGEYPGELNDRLHLDLYTEDQDGEVSRLLSIGARMHREAHEGEDFVELTDPEGNVFCVVDTLFRE